MSAAGVGPPRVHEVIASRLVGIAWVLTIGVVALGHATALRNTATVAVSLATLGLYLRDWRTLPCKTAVSALLLWATASLLWSAAPDVTLGKLRTDFLIPVLAGAATFTFVRQAAGLRYIVSGIGLGLVLLAVFSAFAYAPQGVFPAGWPLEQSSGIVRPLPHWYPGPGDASMFAILAIAPLYLAWTVVRDRPQGIVGRVAVVVAGALCAFILVTTNNRNAVLVAPLVVGLQWLLGRSRVGTPRSGRRSMLFVAACVVGFVVLGAVLEIGARERLTYLHRTPIGDSAAVELVSADTRPTIWRYYVARGLAHPWIGLGFGRTVPGIALRTQADRALADVEPNAYIHAHNVLLNWWLQLGAIGIALLGAATVSVCMVARASWIAAARTSRASRVRHALVAIGLATLARNLTDDFLVYGMATLFSVCVAAMLGELSRLAAAVSATAPRSPSTPS